MTDKISKVCAIISRKITPSKGEKDRITALAEKLEASVLSACKELGVKAEVHVEGSVAKGTWLSEEPDIDVFMRVSPTIPRESLGKTCLKVARKATEGSKQVERFAEHPYLEAFVDDTRVNIVPCYAIERGEWLSATDRTPFHTDYIRKHLNEHLRCEVRLLKRFMKGVGVYGAEIKVGGFSGYLCELLIVHYKGFVNTLSAFAKHKQQIVIDIENHYKNRENDLRLLFNEPLIVIDPVDKARNVASAVQTQKLYSFVAAARAFSSNPIEGFFYPSKTVALTMKELAKKLANHGSSLVVVAFGKVDAVPDILWGQLYKSQRSLCKLIQLNDFCVLRDVAWSNEKTLNAFMFELELHLISSVKKHLGPPLDHESECEKFVNKHQTSQSTVSGPYVADGRWVVETRRKHTDAVTLLKEKLKDGGRSAGIAEQISQVLHQGFKVLVNEEIVEVCTRNREFAEFLTDFLSGRPKWLESVQSKQ